MGLLCLQTVLKLLMQTEIFIISLVNLLLHLQHGLFVLQLLLLYLLSLLLLLNLVLLLLGQNQSHGGG